MYIVKKDLKPVKLQVKGILSIFAILLILSSILGYKCKEAQVIEVCYTDTVLIALDTLELNEENLLKVIKYYDIKFPKVVLAQSKVETGNWTSAICKENNNIFGFRVFGSWKGKEFPFRNRGHLVFKDWQDCVAHYKMWQDKNFTNGSYIKFLKRMGYAEDPSYANTLKKTIKN